MGFLSWLALGAGAALAPFTGGLSLAIGGAAAGALGSQGKGANNSSVINNAVPGAAQTGTGAPGSQTGNWFSGHTQNPNIAPYAVPGALEPWSQALINSIIGKDADGNPTIKGVDKYPGALSPELDKTMLPSVWNSWDPKGGQGQQYLENLMGQGGFQIPGLLQQMMLDVKDKGGLGGAPTGYMTDMAQYGGVPGPGLNAMSNLMQFGVASEAGRPMANLAQFGVTGPGGMPLYNRATGGPTAAQAFLANYQPPPKKA